MNAVPDPRFDYADNKSHSVSVRVLASSQELDRRMADQAHSEWGKAVMELEDAERLLARLYVRLEACGKDMLKAGSRVEPNWDALPLVNAGHVAWMSDRVGPAPIRGVS